MRWLGLLLLQACLSQAATYVIAVGVEQYDDAQISRLSYAVADARSVAAAFRASGAAPKDVIVLTSDAKDAAKRPSRINLLRAFGAVKAQAKVDDKLVFFFAGHGVERNGEHYLLGVDTQRDLLEETALPITVVNKALEGLACGEVLFLIDACRNDPTAGRGDADAELSEEFARGLRPKFTGPTAKPRFVATLLACDAGQRAWESPENGHGAFSLFLVRALSGQGAGADGQVTLSGLSEYVGREVSSWASRSKREQRPRLINPDGGDMVILTAPPEPVVSVAFQNHTLAQAVDLLAEQFSAQIVLGPGADATLTVTGRLDNRPLGTVLKVLVAAHHLTVRREGKIYVIGGAAPPLGAAPVQKAWRPVRRTLVDATGHRVTPLAVACGWHSPTMESAQCVAALRQAGVELVWLQLPSTSVTNGDPGEAFDDRITDLDAFVEASAEQGLKLAICAAVQQQGKYSVTSESASLWSSVPDQARYLRFLEGLARRYAHETDTVIGIGLLTDPKPPAADIWRELTRQGIDAVRRGDPCMPVYLTPPFNDAASDWSDLLPENGMLGGWIAARAYPSSLRANDGAVAIFEVRGTDWEQARGAVLDRLSRGLVPVPWISAGAFSELSKWVAGTPPVWPEFRRAVENARGYPAESPGQAGVVEFVAIPAGHGVRAFEMGKYPVTVAQFRAFVEATGHVTTAEQRGWDTGLMDKRWQQQQGLNWRYGTSIDEPAPQSWPVVHVSLADAQAFAAWLGARLPTGAEWDHAARGGAPDGQRYVWGDQWPPPAGAGNFGDDSSAAVASFVTPIPGYHDGYPTLAPVGSFAPNGYGLCDMVGSVCEWVIGSPNCRGPGYFGFQSPWFQLGFSWQFNNPCNPDLGFRVARDVQP